jgi:hypothetical protein
MTDRKPELRFYTFVNFYLSQIQQGIQTGHAAVDLVRAYEDPDREMQIFATEWYERSAMVGEWADNWKTFIVLNGGDDDTIAKTFTILTDSGLPAVEFRESVQALNGIRTCAGAVIPDYIFNAQFDYHRSKTWPKETPVYSWISPDEGKTEYVYQPGHRYYDLIALLRRSRLA